MILPISGSLFAEIVPTCAISFRPLLGAEIAPPPPRPLIPARPPGSPRLIFFFDVRVPLFPPSPSVAFADDFLFLSQVFLVTFQRDWRAGLPPINPPGG